MPLPTALIRILLARRFTYPHQFVRFLFANFDKCRQEVDEDAKLGVAEDFAGMDVRVIFGDSR